MSRILQKYVPETALPLMRKWFEAYKFHLRITKSRQTKLGDFRPAHAGKPHRISVNGDLNPYHFLITFTHEVAHVICWDKYHSKVSPHGKEWKLIYCQLLQRMLLRVDFPAPLLNEINAHLNNPAASSCSDPALYRALKQYDPPSASCFLEDLPEGHFFELRKKRKFKKGMKRRSRFECLDISNQKLYLVSGHAEVIPIKK